MHLERKELVIINTQEMVERLALKFVDFKDLQEEAQKHGGWRYADAQGKPVLHKSILMHSYLDANGTLEFVNLRFQFEDGTKTCRFAHYDADGNMQFKLPPQHDHLYRLDVLAQANSDRTLYLVEGEKTADAMLQAGLLATTAYGGAKESIPFTCQDLTMLSKFKSIVLIPDNDVPGQKLIQAYDKLSLGIKVLQLKDVWQDCPDKGDMADYLEADLPMEKLLTYKFPAKAFGWNKGATPDAIVQNALTAFEGSDLAPLSAAKELRANKNLLNALASCSEEWRGNFIDAVKAAKVMLSSGLKKLIKEAQREQSSSYKNKIIEGTDVVCPQGYSLSFDGIRKCDPKSGAEFLICDIPIIISTIFKEPQTRKTMVRLMCLRYQWEELAVVPMEVITSKHRFPELFDYGVGLNSNNTTDMIGFFAKYIAVNRSKLEGGIFKTSVGWLDKKFYLPNDTNPLVYLALRDKSLQDKLQTSGSFAAWKALVQDLRSDLIGRFVFAASVAPILLHWLPDDDNFLINLYGRAGIGKTKLLKICASFCGRTSFMETMNSTVNAIEAMADARSGLSLLLDEREGTNNQESAQHREMQMTIYDMFGGQGRNRCTNDGELKEAKHWETVVIMNGEGPLNDDSAKEGQMRRLFDINWEGHNDTFLEKVNSVLADNYGQGIRKFLEKLEQMNLPEELRNWLTIFQKELLAKAKEKELEETLVYGLALFALTDMLVSEFVFEEADAYNTAMLMAETVMEQLPKRKRVDIGTRALEFVHDWINSHPRCFPRSYDLYLDENQYESYGIIQDDKIYFFGNQLKKVLQEGGYDVCKIKASWENSGITEFDKGRKDKYTSFRDKHGKLYRKRTIPVPLEAA